MEIIGITGTNGKTTCTYWIRHLIEGTKFATNGKTARRKVGVIGTLGAFVGDKNVEYAPPKLTTPDATQLTEIFEKMSAMGVNTVVMEVSAHAIAQNRVAGLDFRVKVLTNITQDHLDYFKTFENYANTKLDWIGDSAIIAPQSANFMQSNREVCVAVARELGVNDGVIRRRVKTLRPVSGRFNIINAKRRGVKIIIDYAHTPDGLEKVLNMARQICDSRLISVFGCGGNRDTTKREIMGRISAQIADFTVITSDNPRDEVPNVIMMQIEAGAKTIAGAQFTMVEDRRDATEYAIELARAGDVVVIAGKGAETTQEIAGVFHPYVDEDAVRDIIARKRKQYAGK